MLGLNRTNKIHFVCGLLCFAFQSAKAFNFSDLKSLTESKSFSSIDELLCALPDELQEKAVLIHRSMSLQDASYEKPRVILQNRDASLLVTYNGSPEQTGYNRMEVIEFDYSTSRFRFHELTNDPHAGAKDALRWSKPDPKVCLGCHGGDDPRPNWEPYNQWPGSFGGSAAGISRERSAAAAIELPYFKNFLSQQKNSTRYSYLHSLFDIYLPEVDFYHLENLSTLTQRLSALNMRRVVRRIRNLPFYNEYKFAIFGVIFCERHASQFIPESLLRIHQQVTDGRKEHHSGIDGRHPSLWEELNLIIEAQGEDTRFWSMDFNTNGQFSASHRFMNPNSDSEDQLLGALLEQDSELQNLGNLNQPAEICRQAKVRSLDRLNAHPEIAEALSGPALELLSKRQPRIKALLESERPPPRALLQCASCHASGMAEIPEIPFDDLGELKRQLQSKRDDYRRGTFLSEIRHRLLVHPSHKDVMPPGAHGLDQDRMQVLEYLEDLAK